VFLVFGDDARDPDSLISLFVGHEVRVRDTKNKHKKYFTVFDSENEFEQTLGNEKECLLLL
jgi:hypothetical protein